MIQQDQSPMLGKVCDLPNMATIQNTSDFFFMEIQASSFASIAVEKIHITNKTFKVEMKHYKILKLQIYNSFSFSRQPLLYICQWFISKIILNFRFMWPGETYIDWHVCQR